MTTWEAILLVAGGAVLLGVPIGTSGYAIYVEHRAERRRRRRE